MEQITLRHDLAEQQSSIRRTTVDVVLVVTFAVLTALLAQVSFHLPGTLVPITLQTVAVLASGYFLGSRRAMLSQLAYLAMGAAGLPVFAASPLLPQGLARLFGPTGGYLLAFPLAAWLAGDLLRRDFCRRRTGRLLSLLLATLVVHLGGLVWMEVLAPMSATHAFILLLPFAIVDPVKAALLATVFHGRQQDR